MTIRIRKTAAGSKDKEVPIPKLKLSFQFKESLDFFLLLSTFGQHICCLDYFFLSKLFSLAFQGIGIFIASDNYLDNTNRLIGKIL